MLVAGGVTFLNLEDETGMVNVLFTPGVWACHRRVAQTAPAMLIRGQLQKHQRGRHRGGRAAGPHRARDRLPLPRLPVTILRERALAQKCRSYSAGGVVHTLSTLIFNRVVNAARYSSPIPMLTA